MKILITVLLTVSVLTPAFAENPVALPENYQETFYEYLSLDRTQDPDQFIRLFANEVAMQGRDEAGRLRSGAVIVAEVYKVEKNSDGTVKTSMLGRRIKDQLALLAVMEKQDGYGETSGSPIHTGDWNFGAYAPNGEVATSKDLNACRACHAPLTKTDFLFSIEHLPK